jgi:hypothetical protein
MQHLSPKPANVNSWLAHATKAQRLELFCAVLVLLDLIENPSPPVSSVFVKQELGHWMRLQRQTFLSSRRNGARRRGSSSWKQSYHRKGKKVQW